MTSDRFSDLTRACDSMIAQYKRSEPNLRMSRIDPLTVAYIAMGVTVALQGDARIPDAFEGEIGLMQAVIAHADLLDAMFEPHQNEFAGVYYYDIAYPFGLRYTQQLFADIDTEANARALVEDLFREEKVG